MDAWAMQWCLMGDAIIPIGSMYGIFMYIYLHLPNMVCLHLLGGGNSKIFGIFTPNLGEDEPILTSIFFRWVGSTTNQMKLVLWQVAFRDPKLGPPKKKFCWTEDVFCSEEIFLGKL